MWSKNEKAFRNLSGISWSLLWDHVTSCHCLFWASASSLSFYRLPFPALRAQGKGGSGQVPCREFPELNSQERDGGLLGSGYHGCSSEDLREGRSWAGLLLQKCLCHEFSTLEFTQCFPPNIKDFDFHQPESGCYKCPHLYGWGNWGSEGLDSVLIPRTAVTKYPKLDGFLKRNLLSHSSGG